MSASTSSKVFIPNSLKKTIQNLKEIVKNHSDEEIHAMLKDCNMDPNETVQRLLLQDPFHEVKRKRDKRKENIRELVDGRMKPTSQWRGSHGGKRNYPSRSISHGVVTVNNFKNQNRVQKTMEKSIEISSSSPSEDAQNKLTIPSSLATDMPNGPAKINNPVRKPQSASKTFNVRTVPSNIENLNKATTKTAKVSALDLQHSITDKAASNANPVVQGPSDNAQIPSNVRTIKRKTGKQQVASKTVSSKASEKMQGESQVDGNLTSDASQATRPLSRASSGSRPSSNYSNRSQQLNGPQKVVGPLKEWKPKLVKSASVSEKVENVDGEHKTLEASISYPSSDGTSSKLQTRLEALQVSDTRHVIIPDHLQVSESERTGLSFGSFDANFGLVTTMVKKPESMEGSTEFTEPTMDVVENIEEATSSHHIASASDQEVELADRSSSSAEIQENIESTESEVPSNNQTAPEYDQSKTEAAELSQYPVVAQTAPTYSNFGLAPQMTGNQFVKVEAVESLSHDSTRNSSFQVQQQFDPATSYYASVYRPAVTDGDVRFSPIFAPATTKYVTVQTGQTQQESGVSSSGSVPVATQAAALGQQSVPIFRQPPGVHLSHYPTNYLPYNQYLPSQFYLPPPPMHPFLSNATFPQQPPGVHLSHYPTNYLPYNQYLPPQFYLPPPPMHPFLSNATFAQQPQPGSLYPGMGPTGAAPMKYVSQYKSASNVGNPSQFVIPTGSEDLASSRYKENNVYAAGQQSEASGWIPIPGRDITQSTPFYNLPPSQGQPMTFPGIYHHATQAAAPGTIHPMLQQSQTMSGPVEMVGPPSAVYQQPQRTQMNWVNNY